MIYTLAFIYEISLPFATVNTSEELLYVNRLKQYGFVRKFLRRNGNFLLSIDWISIKLCMYYVNIYEYIFVSPIDRYLYYLIFIFSVFYFYLSR